MEDEKWIRFSKNILEQEKWTMTDDQKRRGTYWKEYNEDLL